MTARKTVLALALAASSLYATQAGAFFASYDEESGDRPPPNGLNGASVNGLADQHLAGGIKSGHDASDGAMLKAVVLPDGSRILVK